MFKSNKRVGVVNKGGKHEVLSHVRTDRQFEENAFTSFGLAGGPFSGSNSVSLTAVSGAAQRFIPMLEGLLPTIGEAGLRPFYQDMYKYDAIAGPAVDMMSTVPFGNWTLTGLEDSMLDRFNDSLAQINLQRLLPEASVDYLVNSQFVASLIFDKDKQSFVDVLPYNLDDVTFDTVPLYNVDPVIKISLSKDLRKFLTSTSPNVVKIRNALNPQFVSYLSQGGVVLDPYTTMYLERKTSATSEPTSWLKRLLPIYLIEKILYRGTITEAGKRQRATTHIVVGDEDWQPTSDEMSSVVALFQQADFDPLGAFVATRSGVFTEEIRRGGDFWKWTDVQDIFIGMKTRALGISEGFLSGDSTYSNAEAALNVAMQSFNTYRNYFTNKVFNNKLLPLIAVANGFIKAGSKVRLDDERAVSELLANTNQLDIPTVRWHQSLTARSDPNYLETLQELTAVGLPIPLRMWAAAGGISLESLLQELPEDVELREKLKGYLPEERPNTESGEETEESSAFNLMRKVKKIPLLSRNYDALNELYTTTKTGKKKAVYNQSKAQTRANLVMAKVLEDYNNKAMDREFSQLKRKYRG